MKEVEVNLVTKNAGQGKYQKMTMSPKEYKAFAKSREPSRSTLSNCLKAFLIGGTICIIGQAIQEIFITAFKMTTIEAGSPTVAVLIFISVILTCLGVYDKIAQWAGAGTAVPVTGFVLDVLGSA